jgi:hypothetical protein
LFASTRKGAKSGQVRESPVEGKTKSRAQISMPSETKLKSMSSDQIGVIISQTGEKEE